MPLGREVVVESGAEPEGLASECCGEGSETEFWHCNWFCNWSVAVEPRCHAWAVDLRAAALELVGAVVELVVVDIERCRTVALGGGGVGVGTGCDGCVGGCGVGTVVWSGGGRVVAESWAGGAVGAVLASGGLGWVEV